VFALAALIRVILFGADPGLASDESTSGISREGRRSPAQPISPAPHISPVRPISPASAGCIGRCPAPSTSPAPAPLISLGERLSPAPRLLPALVNSEPCLGGTVHHPRAVLAI
jgi:hypothetical protein